MCVYRMPAQPPLHLDIRDHTDAQLQENSSLHQLCQGAAHRRVERRTLLPELYIDPLMPLPLAEAAHPAPAVRFVYLIMASRSYAYETINRNINALQLPGATEQRGSNETNLFLIHVDAKMAPQPARTLREGVRARPDVYFLRRSRPVMWAGWSMMLVLLDALASLLARPLHFEYVINLSDADLSLRVHGEIRAFFARFPSRSIMSIVQRKRDPKRYKMHERFRQFCWVECDEGKAFLVSRRDDEQRADVMQVMGRRKCCWSRTAPLVYTAMSFRCPSALLPEVFHGSQWVSLHHSLVEYIVLDPHAQRILAAMENTLLPDEALLQTLAVNSPFRSTLIPSHLRFIEWPQMHGDANKYWASVGPQFHGGPMVLNASLAHKAFQTPTMFARKVDPSLYFDAFTAWDKWMAVKLITQAPAAGQPLIANHLIEKDPLLNKGLPPPTPFEDMNLSSHTSSVLTYSAVFGSSRPYASVARHVGAPAMPVLSRSDTAQDHDRDAKAENPTSVAWFILVWCVLLALAGVAWATVLCVHKTLDLWASSRASLRAVEKQAWHPTKLV